MADIASLSVRFHATGVEAIEEATDRLNRRFHEFSAKQERAFTTVRNAGMALAGFGAAITGGIGLGVKVAADFEHQMAQVLAVTGATDAQMEAMRQVAIRIGRDTSISASEAANAIEVLGMMGLSVEEIVGGAADAAVNLAESLGIAVPDAAHAMAATLRAWNIDVADATIATDLFAAAATKSSLQGVQLADAFRVIGPMARALGVDIHTTSAALAILANRGIDSQYAAVGLRQGFVSLLSPTKEAQQLMDDLGITLFDANGQFRGLDTVLDELAAAFADLSEEQKAAAAVTLFGVRGQAIFLELMDAGGEEVREMTAALSEQGIAAEMARARLDSLRGAVTILKGSIETVQIIIGSFFLPTLRRVVEVMTTILNAWISLPRPIQLTSVALVTIIGMTALLSGTFLLLLPRIMMTVRAFRDLRLALAVLSVPAGPIFLAIAAVAALGTAYVTNLFGVRAVVDQVVGRVVERFHQLTRIASAVAGAVRTIFGVRPTAGGLLAITGPGGLLEQLRAQLLGLGLSVRQVFAISDAVEGLIMPFRRVRNTLIIAGRAIRDFVSILGGEMPSLEKFERRLSKLFGVDAARQLVTATLRLRAALRQLGRAFREAFGFRLGDLFSLERALGALVTIADRASRFFRRDLVPAIGLALIPVLRGASVAIEVVAGQLGRIVGVAATVASAIRGQLRNAFAALAALLRGDIAGAAAAVGTTLRSLLTGGIDVGRVLVRVGSWALDAAQSLVTRVVAWVRDELWPRVIPIAEAVVEVTRWTLRQVPSLLRRAIQWVQDDLWPRVIPIAMATVEVTRWTLRQFASLFRSAVQWVSDDLWPRVIPIAEAVVEVTRWTLRQFASLARRAARWVQDDLWPGVIQIAEATVEVAAWFIKTIPSQVWGRFDNAADWVRDQLFGDNGTSSQPIVIDRPVHVQIPIQPHPAPAEERPHWIRRVTDWVWDQFVLTREEQLRLADVGREAGRAVGFLVGKGLFEGIRLGFTTIFGPGGPGKIGERLGIPATLLFAPGLLFTGFVLGFSDAIDEHLINPMLAVIERKRDELRAKVVEKIEEIFQLPSWSLRVPKPVIEAWESGMGLAGAVISEIGLAIGKIKNLRAALPSWSLRVPKPVIEAWESGMGLAGAVISEIGLAIGKIKNLRTALPSWSLRVPIPDLVSWQEAWSLADSVADEVILAVEQIIGVAAKLPSWVLNLPRPDFPDLNLAKIKDWIIEWIKEQMPDGISVPFPVPLRFTFSSEGAEGGDGGGGQRGFTTLPAGLLPGLSAQGFGSGALGVRRPPAEGESLLDLSGLPRAAEAARAAVANEFVGLRNDLTRLAERARAAVANEFVGLRNDLTRLAERARAAVANEFVGLRNDLTRLAERARAAVANEFVGLRNDLTRLAERARAAVANEFVGLRGDLTRLAAGARAAVANEFVGLRASVRTLSEAARAAVANQFVGLRNDLARIAGGIGAVVAGAIRAAIGPASNAAWALGANIGAALASGMISQLQAVRNAAAALANAANQALAWGVGAHSPARVFVQFGRWIAEGLALGMSAGEPGVARASAGLALASQRGFGSPLRAQMGARGARHAGPTYVLINPIVGRDMEGYIRRLVASGQARVAHDVQAQRLLSEVR